MSIPRFLGMGNRLRPFPDTPDRPEWPKWPFWAILARSKLAEIVTWVQSMLQTWFWCLSPCFWTWEIYLDHFQTPQINLCGQNGHFGQFWPGLNWPKLQLGFRACYRLDFGVYPEVFGHGKLIESISGCSPPGASSTSSHFFFAAGPAGSKNFLISPGILTQTDWKLL